MQGFEQLLIQNPAWAFVTTFIAGLLTSLTPCVYPMIPITVSLFGAKEAKHKRTAVLLASCYVLGIALMYAGFGVVAALGGWAMGTVLASAWFIIPLSMLFLALSASMFGFWELRLPFWLQQKIATVGNASYGGAFAMGLVGGILIAPCTGPVLAGILTYVATTKNMVLGAGLLFTYALGIGVLFLVIATFAVSLPKSGPWMEHIKSLLGIALVVSALYFLQNIFAPLRAYTSGEMRFFWIQLGLIAAGIILGALHLGVHRANAMTLFRKLIGISLMSVGLFGIVNFTMTPTVKLKWHYEEQVALEAARKSDRPIFVDVWARWCVPCRTIEANVLTNPRITRELARYVLWKVDVSEQTDRDRRLQEKYQAPELPQFLILDAQGNIVKRSGKDLSTVDAMYEFLK